MTRLLLTARRRGALAIGAESAAAALAAGAPLAVVAADAAAMLCREPEVERAILAGRAVVFGTKGELGALLRAGEVSMCALSSPPLAEELQFMRGAVDAGRAAMGAGAECSRSPEGR